MNTMTTTTPRPSYAAIAHHESFKHERLKLSSNYIRLFQVQSATQTTDPISLRVTQFAITRRPPYRAISYTWGSGVDSMTILVNGRSFSIHRNLWDLLFHLRLRGETAFLWADRVCIDQDNLAERNFHVKLMGRIYDLATLVIVWLGVTGLERIEVRAFEFVREVATVSRKDGKSLDVVIKTYLDDGRMHHRWETLLRMCRHHYWTRTWIIQEFLRAPDVVVLCGKWSLDWSDFDELLGLLMADVRLREHVVVKPLFATRPVRLALRRQTKSRSTLFELLQEYHDSMCTERRDKVYGILGLASDCELNEESGVVRGIHPDYKKHIVEVYLDAVACITESLPSSSLIPSAANLVMHTLMLTKQDLEDYIANVAPHKDLQPSMTILPSYVGVIRSVTGWTSTSDLRQKLSSIAWGEYMGYQVTPNRPGLGRRSSLRTITSTLPEDLIQNVVNAAEMDSDLMHLHNYPAVDNLHIPFQHIILHTEDKRLCDNDTSKKPLVFLEQATGSEDVRLGFACTNAKYGDLVLQFQGLDVAIIARQVGLDVELVGKSILIKHGHLEHQYPLDSVCQISPWISPCLKDANRDSLQVRLDALSLAELITRS